jgi:hypothetical protein
VAGKYPFEQLIRAQRWQQQHADWDIKSVDGGSHFVAEQKVTNGAHIIADPSLKSLMDTLEGRDAIKRAAEAS